MQNEGKEDKSSCNTTSPSWHLDMTFWSDLEKQVVHKDTMERMISAGWTLKHRCTNGRKFWRERVIPTLYRSWSNWGDIEERDLIKLMLNSLETLYLLHVLFDIRMVLRRNGSEGLSKLMLKSPKTYTMFYLIETGKVLGGHKRRIMSWSNKLLEIESW